MLPPEVWFHRGGFKDGERVTFTDEHGVPHYIEVISTRREGGNVLTNAMDAVEGRESPQVRIDLARSGERLVITLKDNGCGILPEIRNGNFLWNLHLNSTSIRTAKFYFEGTPCQSLDDPPNFRRSP